MPKYKIDMTVTYEVECEADTVPHVRDTLDFWAKEMKQGDYPLPINCRGSHFIHGSYEIKTSNVKRGRLVNAR